MKKLINKKVIGAAIALSLTAGVSSNANATLTADAILDFTDGTVFCVIGGTAPDACTHNVTNVNGSFFGMDTSGNGIIENSEKTALTSAGTGITIGTAQAIGEIDQTWSFGGNPGNHHTLQGLVLDSATGNTASLDMTGWTVFWNGGDIDMGAGTDAGNNLDHFATITCAVDCAVGDTFTLDYAANVPTGAFAGFFYTLNLEGTIGNHAPVAVADDINPAYLGSAVSLNPATNDTDADAGETATLTATCNSDSSKGTVTDNGDSTCTYQPGATSADIGADSYTYTVTDVNGATSSGTVNVTITDQDAPVISITTGTDSIELGGTWTDTGATATDNLDDNATVTANIVVTGTVDTSTEGPYDINYNVDDAAGNSAIQATRTVNITADITPPSIALTGSDPIDLILNDTYVELGAVCSDNADVDKAATVGGDTVVTTSAPATFTITYDCSDNAGNNASQVTRTVNVVSGDTVAPTITITGATPLNLNINEAYVESGAVCSDNVDADKAATVGGDTVVSTTPATFTITYNCSDNAGNSATQVTRTVNVADTSAPTITLNGSSPVNLSLNDTYSEQGAVCSDNFDADKAATVGGDTIVTTAPATFTVTYNCSDNATNPAMQVTRAVNVSDTIPPVISVLSGIDSVEAGSIWSDAGATATDNIDGTLTVITTGNVNTSLVGTYIITYSATDTAGNTGTDTRSVDVTADVTAPVITVNQGTDTIAIGGSWTDAGATASDNLDGTIPVITTGSVDTNTAGDYTITYTATDEASNATTATRTVTVADDVIVPVITLTGGDIKLEQDTGFNDPGAICSDNLDPARAISTNDTVDDSTIGIYVVTYACTDTSGNAATDVTRTVEVTKATTDANGCSMSPTPIDATKSADWWVVAGFIGFMAVRRRKMRS